MGPQIAYFVLSGHLDEKVHNCHLERGRALEITQPPNHFITDFNRFLILLGGRGADISNPIVLERLTHRETPLGVVHEQLSDQVFALG